MRQKCMFEAQPAEFDAYDPRRCQMCGHPTELVRVIRRTFQDDLEVWECRSCGASVTQIVNLAKLGRQTGASTYLN